MRNPLLPVKIQIPGDVRSTYIHIPFCSHRCGYCNFALVAGRSDLVPSFLSALEKELAQTFGVPREMDTLFLGGGTPSFLSPQALTRLLELLTHWVQLTEKSEFSVEVNPLDCCPEKLKILHAAGVNRISLGGQSFSARKLKLLERDHSPAELLTALENCDSLFNRVALDLIFGAPNETPQEWRSDLEQALASPAYHVSTYGLTIEKGSLFYGRLERGTLSEISDDLQRDLYEAAIDTFQAAGWEHYEVSNFAVPGQRCRHNEAYWLGKYWYGLGPGAASFLPLPGYQPDIDKHFAERCVNHRSTSTYLKRLETNQSPIAERDALDSDQYLRERVVFGLRRLEGIHIESLNQEFQMDVRSAFEPKLSEFIAQGWLRLESNSQLQLSREGLMISDGLWPHLLAPSTTD